MRYIIAIIFLVFSTVNLATDDDVVPAKLVQLILDSKELDQYWHPEIKERVPLKLWHRCIATAEGIKKHGENIVLIKERDHSPYLEISRCSLNEGIWTVSVVYPVEGVSGEFKARRLSNQQWEIISVSVIES